MGVYESESRLEEKLINQLIKQGYKKVQIDTVKDLYQLYEDKLKMDKPKYSAGYAKKLVVGETEVPEYPSEESQQKRGRKK